MSDLLTRMTERTLGIMPSLQPKLASVYEPGQMLENDGISPFADTPAPSESPTVLATPGSNAPIVRGIFPSSVVAPTPTTLAISRLSHNLSGEIWQNPPSQSQKMDLNSIVPTPAAPELPIVANTDGVEIDRLPTVAPNLTPNPDRLTSLVSPTLLPQPSGSPPLTSPTARPDELRIDRQPIAPDLVVQPPVVSIVTSVTNNIPTLSPTANLVAMGNLQQPIESPPVNSSRTVAPIQTIDRLPIATPVATATSLTQPLATNDRAPGQAIQPLATNDRAPGGSIQTLVPMAVRQLERSNAARSPDFSPRVDLAPASPPTIQVKIGRIEIRAIANKAAPPPPARSTTAVPQLSLGDYLKSRGGS
jgi:hypothetical protein